MAFLLSRMARHAKVLSLILIAMGLAVSGYLLMRHFALTDPAGRTGADFCSALFGRGCDDALRADGAIQLGVPLAGWGLVYYGTLLSLLLTGWILGRAFRFEAMVAAFLIAAFGAAGSIALFIAMVTPIAPFCPMCATIHAINLLLLFPLKRLTGCSIRQLFQTSLTGVRYLFGGKVNDPVAARWTVVGYFASALVSVVIYQWVFVEYTLHKRPAEAPLDPRQTMAMFLAGQQHEIPISDADSQLGPADALVQMVIFNDLQCPGCRQLAKTIPGLVTEFGDTLHVVFKHFPLDSVCNSLLREELHPRACQAAWAGEAARAQGKFWDYHEALIHQRSGAKKSLKSVVESLRLDVVQFEADRHGESARTKVLEDVALGIRLGVDGTPAVFINGRRVYDTRPQALAYLIARQPAPRDRMVSQHAPSSSRSSASSVMSFSGP